MANYDSLEFKVPEIIPYLISMNEDSREIVFENGILPEPGDQIVAVCYEVESGRSHRQFQSKDFINYKCRFRVKRSLKRRLKEFFRIK